MKGRLQNSKSENFREERFQMQENHWLRDWANYWFGGSHELQPDSFTEPARASPSVKLFITFRHIIDWSPQLYFHPLRASENTARGKLAVSMPK